MKIFIDPGHGGNDNGAVWKDKLGYIEEDDTNLSIAHFLNYELRLLQYKTKMSRVRDEFVSLTKRVDMANGWKANAFVSIHCDAFHNTTISGMSVYHFPNSPNMLAHSVMDQMRLNFPNHIIRGVKEANFAVLRLTKMKAVLIECEFLSNPNMRRFLKEPGNQVDLAKAIATGIDKYLRNK